MVKDNFSFEEMTNFEQKWFCLFLIDVSVSMSDEALMKVNEELQRLHRLVKEDVTSSQRIVLCVMTFGQDVKVIQTPALVENFTMPTVFREGEVTHAIYAAVEVIKAREQWCKETGQCYYRPCLILVTDEADEKLFRSEDMRHLNDDLQQKKYDCLIVGMNGSSVYAHSTGMKINLKETRSLAQMLFSVWGTVKWGYDACERPLTDDFLTGLVDFEI